MNQITYKEFSHLVATEDICFINSYENAVVRTEHLAGVYYVKFKGENEFKAEKGSRVVAGGLEEHTVITKVEYDTF